MSARKFIPAIPASQARTDAGPYLNPFAALNLDLNNRIADLGAKLARWHDNREAELEEQRNDARIEAEYQDMLDAEADALADAIDAGDCAEDGEPIPHDTYRSAV